MASVTTLCTMGIIVISGWSSCWLLPLQFLALTRTSHRVRRVLFDEAWPFHRYLIWRVRIFAGMLGFWCFIAVAPTIVASAPSTLRWWICGALVALGLAWHHWHGRVLLFMLGATRLERPDLEEPFRRVLDRANAAVPALWRAGASGGVLANAFALPSLSRSGVLFFDTLLERLSPEEVTAILAHEVAHLEQFTRRRLLSLYAVTVTTILLMIIGIAAAASFAPKLQSWVGIISFGAVFAGFWLRARRMQAHETGADLRAIALCDNPEALVSALTRIHTINHIPRRWSVHAEERATHPSLARRIRSIRHASSAPPMAIERLVVASPHSGRHAVIDGDRVGFLWTDGDIAERDDDIIARARRTETLTYDQLSELRLAATRGGITLTAVDHQARRWSMPVHMTDAARVQAALDLVDHMVVATPATGLGMGQRLGVLMVLVIAMIFNALSAVIAPGILALRRPTRPVMAGLAMGLAGSALLAANNLVVSQVRITALALLALLTLLSLVQRRRQTSTPSARVWVWIERLGFVAPVGAGLVVIAANTHDLFGLHTAVRDHSWFIAALMALAGYLALSADRASRRLGGFAGVLAVVAIWMGSPWFLLDVVGDPLIAVMPSFAEQTVPLTTVSRRAVDGEFNIVSLTPDAHHFLLSGDSEEESQSDEENTLERRRFLAGGFDGWSRELRATDVVWIDNHRMLVLHRDWEGSELQAEDLRTAERLWLVTLPGIDASDVRASPSGHWRVTARRANEFARIEGQIGTTGVSETRWTFDADRGAYLDHPHNDGGPVAFTTATKWDEPTTPFGSDWEPTTTLLRAGAERTTTIAASRLRVECLAPPIDTTGYFCVAFDGRWSRFWRFDVAGSRLLPVGRTRRALWGTWQDTSQRVAGISNGRPVLVGLDSATILTLAPARDCWTDDFAITGEWVVTTCASRGKTNVILHRVADRPR
jgi:Zn-dependent protease with chaperone function